MIQKVHIHILHILIISIKFQDLFHSLLGVLFTFPSRYCALSNYLGISVEVSTPFKIFISTKTINKNR